MIGLYQRDGTRRIREHWMVQNRRNRNWPKHVEKLFVYVRYKMSVLKLGYLTTTLIFLLHQKTSSLHKYEKGSTLKFQSPQEVLCEFVYYSQF